MPSSKLISPNRRRFLLAAAAAAPALSLHAQEDEETAKAGKVPAAIAALKARVQEAVPITLAEREGRLEKARSLMKAKQMDALIITVGTSLNYFSGLKVGYQSERLFAWILPASGAPFVVCPAFEEGRIREGLTMARMGQRRRSIPGMRMRPVRPGGTVAEGPRAGSGNGGD